MKLDRFKDRLNKNKLFKKGSSVKYTGVGKDHINRDTDVDVVTDRGDTVEVSHNGMNSIIHKRHLK